MQKQSIRRSFMFTFKGIKYLLLNERNFKIHIIGLGVNIFLINYLPLTSWEMIGILIVSFLVLITEALNTCIEKVCDYLQPKYDIRIGIIKDIAGGAVLLATILAIFVGIIIYWKYIF